MGLLRDFLVKTVVNGLALWLTALVVTGIHFGQSSDLWRTTQTILLVGLLFGLVNALIKPVVKLLSFPLIVVTLGLFTLVVNALMLGLTSWLSGQLGLAFHVDAFFWDAVLGALVVTFVSMLLNVLVPDGDRRR